MPAGKPGELIRSESFEEYELPFSVSAVRILYHSRSAAGEDVAASGVILIPLAKENRLLGLADHRAGTRSYRCCPFVCSLADEECRARAVPLDVCEPWIRRSCYRLYGVGNRFPECIFAWSLQRDRCHYFHFCGPRRSPRAGREVDCHGRGGRKFSGCGSRGKGERASRPKLPRQYRDFGCS